MTKIKTALLIIDAQWDFCNPSGSLFVNGAVEDCKNLASFISEKDPDEIFLTMDSHFVFHIAHSAFWVDDRGNHPAPYTQISSKDVKNGKFIPVGEGFSPEDGIAYLDALEEKGRYVLTIWPNHCIVGTKGHNLDETIHNGVMNWAHLHRKNPHYVMKGSYPFSEHYSILSAEVQQESIPETCVNKALLERLASAERIFVAGEALSHCVLFSLLDIAKYISPSKMTLLRNCSSPIAGFETATENKLHELEKQGLEILL